MIEFVLGRMSAAVDAGKLDGEAAGSFAQLVAEIVSATEEWCHRPEGSLDTKEDFVRARAGLDRAVSDILKIPRLPKEVVESPEDRRKRERMERFLEVVRSGGKRRGSPPDESSRKKGKAVERGVQELAGTEDGRSVEAAAKRYMAVVGGGPSK